MVVPVSDIAFRIAWAQGEAPRSDPTSSDYECPHYHSETEVRFAWLEGFKAAKAWRFSASEPTSITSTEQHRRHSITKAL